MVPALQGAEMECEKVQEGVVGVSPECRAVGEGEHPQWEGVGQALVRLSAQAVGQEAAVLHLPSLPPSEVFSHETPLQTYTLTCLVSPLNDYLELLRWSGVS